MIDNLNIGWHASNFHIWVTIMIDQIPACRNLYYSKLHATWPKAIVQMTSQTGYIKFICTLVQMIQRIL